MEEVFKAFAGYVALGVEAAAVLFIAIGAAEALFNVVGFGLRLWRSTRVDST